MKNVIELFLAGLLVVTSFMLPSPPARAEVMLFPLIPISESVLEAVKGSAAWKTCGLYFAGGDSEMGWMVHFSASNTDTLKPVFFLSPASKILLLLDASQDTPIVILNVVDQKIVGQSTITLNIESYKQALPCFANGTAT